MKKKTASGQIKRQVNALTRNPISIVDYQRPFHKADKAHVIGCGEEVAPTRLTSLGVSNIL